MDAALYAVCAAAGWIALAYKLRDLRRQPTNPAIRAIVTGYFSFAAGVTMAIPPLADRVDAWTHIPNLAKLLSHAGVFGIAASVEVLLLYLALPADQARPKARRRVAVSALAFSAMVGLAVYVAVTDPEARFLVEDAGIPAVALYLTIYLSTYIGYNIDIVRLCWRFAAVTPRPWLRRGLRIAVAGGIFSLVYAVNKLGYFLAFLAEWTPPGERQITAVVVTIASVLFAIGFTMPAWGPAITRAQVLVKHRRANRALEPLWRAISTIRPGIVLDDGLHRRITEIRDGQRALFQEGRVDARIAPLARELAATAGLDPDEQQVVAEAAQIATGIHMATAGLTAATPDPGQVHNPPGGYEGEVDHLTRISHAYTNSPVIAQVQAAVTNDALPTSGGVL
jgi:hypothetical protein